MFAVVGGGQIAPCSWCGADAAVSVGLEALERAPLSVIADRFRHGPVRGPPGRRAAWVWTLSSRRWRAWAVEQPGGPATAHALRRHARRRRRPGTRTSPCISALPIAVPGRSRPAPASLRVHARCHRRRPGGLIARTIAEWPASAALFGGAVQGPLDIAHARVGLPRRRRGVLSRRQSGSKASALAGTGRACMLSSIKRSAVDARSAWMCAKASGATATSKCRTYPSSAEYRMHCSVTCPISVTPCTSSWRSRYSTCVFQGPRARRLLEGLARAPVRRRHRPFRRSASPVASPRRRRLWRGL